MANNIIKRTWNQNRMVNIDDLTGFAFQSEDGGHTFEISGIDDTGAAVSLTGTVAGVFRRPDNADIALTGSASDGKVYVTLDDDCYSIPGAASLTVFVTSNSQKVAVYAAVLTVAQTSGGGVAGSTPQDVVDLINAIAAAVATIPADYTDLMAAVAPAYSNSAVYAVGSYAWYDGTLYRCTTAITTAESWTAAHWTAAVLGNDVRDINGNLKNVTVRQSVTSLKDLITDPGSVYYENGANNNSSATLSAITRSGYIRVSKGDLISFSGVRNTTGTATVAFYDENFVYDQSLSVAGTGSAGQSGKVTISKFGYVRFSCRNQELAGATFTVQNSIGVKEDKLSSDTLFLHNQATKANFILLNVGEILKNNYSSMYASDGSIESTARATGVTDFFPCKPGDKLEYKLSVDTNYGMLCTYDENFDFVRCVATGTGTSSYIESSYTFQSDEKYFRVSGKTVDVYYNNYYLKYETTSTLLPEIKAIDERVTALEAEELPSYWKTYMTAKYPTLWAKDAQIGSGGDSFVFVTDIHYERNLLVSPKLIRAIIDNTAVKSVFCGGDMIDKQDTAALAIEKMEKWQGLMHGIRAFNIVGNHDNNNYNSSQPDAELTKGQYYGVMIKPEEQWINTGGELYYCVDNESQKIRYIILAIECFDNVGTSGTQRTWLQSKLTEKDSGWTVLVLQHRIWGSTTTSIDTKAQNVINAINEVWANINAKFIGILAGHTHLDYSETESVHGYQLIAVNCDANTGSNSGYTRTAGTTTEQSFDVFYIDKTNEKLYAVRIGAGDDSVGSGSGIREFSY